MASLPHHFPAELWSTIIQHVYLGSEDLASLCAVSRVIRTQTQRYLWQDIELNNLRKILSWAGTLAVTPRLGAYTTKLRLVVPTYLDFQPAGVGPVIQAMRACHNLRELALHVKANDPFASYFDRLLVNQRFRLVKFTSTNWKLPNVVMETFFLQQKGISALSIDHPHIPTGTLPNLSSVCLNLNVAHELFRKNSELKRPRPIRHVTICCWDTNSRPQDQPLRAMSRCWQHLTSLHIWGSDSYFSRRTVLSFIPELLKELQSLLHFRFTDEAEKYATLNRPIFYEPLQSSRLRVLVFVHRKPPNASSGDDGDGPYIVLKTAEGRKTTAQRLLKECSSLRTVVLGSNHHFQRSLDGVSIQDMGRISNAALNALLPADSFHIESIYR